ncbi:universal stress protein [Nocardioides lentus]|uniref:Universal stress protein n=1 Tax=Nocardioides lentus TaxID=338077 RepID=A0ABN2P7Y6_9ACTN
MQIPSVRPGSVVAGVDGSRDSRRAVVLAAELASRERRPLALVHGADPSTLLRDPAWALMAGVDQERLSEAVREGARGLLAEAVVLAEHVAPDVTCATATVEADARATLLELSRVAHVLVLGSRGRGPLRSPVLGSVSATVARRAHCPVIVSRRPPRDPAADGDPVRGIGQVVVGCDATGGSRAAVEAAFRQAALWRAPLRVVHCFWDVDAALHGHGAVPPRAADDTTDLRLLLAETLAGLQEKYPDVRVTPELRRGLVDVCLPEGLGADALLVVGRSEADHRSWHVSTALAVLERAHTAVLVVPGVAGGPS